MRNSYEVAIKNWALESELGTQINEEIDRLTGGAMPCKFNGEGFVNLVRGTHETSLWKSCHLPVAPNPSGPICIEAAHIYADEFEPNSSIDKQLGVDQSIHQEVFDTLSRAGLLLANSVLIDDVNMVQKHTVEDRWRADAFTNRALGVLCELFSPDLDLVIKESHGFIPAKDCCSKLIKVAKEKGIKIIHDEKGVWLEGELIDTKDNKIRIMGKEDDPNYPSCNVLDFVAYNRKFKVASVAITILPIALKEQQKRVKAIFNLLGANPPIINVFYDKNARKEVYSWDQ